MLSVLRRARKSLGHLALVAATAVLAACVPGGGLSPSGGSGSGAIQVALLVPGGSGQLSDEVLAKSLENAARLAMGDLQNVEIDLRVYNTAGSPSQAAAQAQKAVAEGAQVILGPVFAQEANAAGVAVAASGVNVLSFSNNPDIAGNNVFVLGPTFDNTAARLASFAVRQGKGNIMIVHDRNTAGTIGRAAIERGVRATGGTVVSVGNYEFSQNGRLGRPGFGAHSTRDRRTGCLHDGGQFGGLALDLAAFGRQRAVLGGCPVHRADPLGYSRRDLGPARRAGRLVCVARSGAFRAVPKPLYRRLCRAAASDCGLGL